MITTENELQLFGKELNQAIQIQLDIQRILSRESSVLRVESRYGLYYWSEQLKKSLKEIDNANETLQLMIHENDDIINEEKNLKP